ncbi:hypothetical protein BKA65DRAFT_403161 [Rhexocercosporidium sp. MPI-PUGE-AT-0058]|nr:hypothetical protein BKA65DRAFT_403161 [Rhexocercosporidium sp. MPI-PUGE-AT-0058]
MSKPKYGVLSGSAGSFDDESPEPRHKEELTRAEADIHHSCARQNRPGIYIWVLVLLLTILIFVLGIQIQVGDFRASGSRHFKAGNCGKTMEEARDKGCVMDLISGSWVPLECYDEQLEKQFLGEADWQWFSDQDGQHELSEEFIRETGGPNPYFVTKEYHNLHCAYTWMKLHKAVLLNGPIDSHIGNYKHTNHCSRSMIPIDEVEKKAPSAFYHIFAKCDLPQNSKCWSFLHMVFSLTDP